MLLVNGAAGEFHLSSSCICTFAANQSTNERDASIAFGCIQLGIIRLIIRAPLIMASLNGVGLYVVCDIGVICTYFLQYGSTPLMAAALWGHDGCVRHFLDRGADVDHQDEVSALRISPVSLYVKFPCVKRALCE